MKLNGQSFSAPCENITFKRGEQLISLKAQGLVSLDLFEKMVEVPQPPTIREPGKAPQAQLNDPGYLAAVKDYGELRTAFVIIYSLAATPGLTWDKVVPEDPSTWLHWQQELVDLGLIHFEIEEVVKQVTSVNGLSGSSEDARKAFLAFLAAANQAK